MPVCSFLHSSYFFCAGDFGWRFTKGQSSLSSFIEAVFCPQQVVCDSSFFLSFCCLFTPLWCGPSSPKHSEKALSFCSCTGETGNSGFVLILKK